MDPLKNIDCGSSYLRKMRARFGSLRLALVAYNTGPGTLTRRGVTPAGREYLRRFVAAGGVL
jgi:soluble lytic murein transglycosylase-like protein